jgi:hypothetical protein
VKPNTSMLRERSESTARRAASTRSRRSTMSIGPGPHRPLRGLPLPQAGEGVMSHSGHPARPKPFVPIASITQEFCNAPIFPRRRCSFSRG